MTLCSDKSSRECALALDFTQATAVEGWAAIDDRVMGGLSKSSLVFHPDGYAVFTGMVSLENGGGFASVRHPCLRLGDAQTVGYRLHVRGDGKRYKLNLRMDSDFDGVNHQALFQPPAGRWVEGLACSLPAGVASRHQGLQRLCLDKSARWAGWWVTGRLVPSPWKS